MMFIKIEYVCLFYEILCTYSYNNVRCNDWLYKSLKIQQPLLFTKLKYLPYIFLKPSRPSLAQVKALIDFIQKHPDLAHRKLRNGVSRQKVKKLWVQFSNIANSMDGTLKSSNGWIKVILQKIFFLLNHF